MFAGMLAVALLQIVRVAPTPTPQQWHEDLAMFAAEMPRRHLNLYHAVPESTFRRAVQRLDSLIPRLARHEIYVEFARLAALIGDTHSGIGTLRGSSMDFHRLPLDMRSFTDGIVVRRTTAEHRNLLGARVVAVGDTPIKTVYDSIAQLVATDPNNPMRVKDVVPIMLGMPEVAAAFHFTNSLNGVSMTFEKNGMTFTETVAPTTRAEYNALTWIDYQERPSLATKRPEVKYRFEYVPGQKMMYVQINEMANDTTEALTRMFHRAVVAATAAGAARFVIDLRGNDGGSSGVNRSMMLDLINNPAIDRHGRLFVLIGRVTASAAENFVNELEHFTNAVFVGEPTGQNPRFFSDAYTFTLPHSQITSFAATIWFQGADARDNRPYTPPAIAAEQSSADYRMGRDPAIDAVLSYRAVLPLPLRLAAIGKRLGARAAADTLAAVGRDPASKYRTSLSREMIRYTYDVLWWDKRYNDGVLVLEANAMANDGDWNAHDALAGALEEAGKRSLALPEYERALALNPGNTNIQAAVRRLKESVRPQ